ncbi:glycosyltransferase family 2 protein [Carnobacterium maltaromaticum]|uniref:glycosyltransferase family 2 protein n=1 Tax=Carnobacterium maltaromaticum TaxID=2751 RepID=UPI0039BE35F3
MSDLISLIVPVYNVETYLEKCLLSIMKQTYENIEIIVVNDGSTDDSLQIANKLKDIDDRILVFSKDNGGLASARNFGLTKSRGEYIIYIDSDDYISSKHVENLYNTLGIYNADIAVSKMKKVDTEGKLIGLSSKDTNNSCLLSKKEALKQLFLQKKFDNSASAKIYKRKICENYQFPEGRLYEDFATIYKMFLCVEKVSYVDSSDYFYVQRPLSIINSEFNEKKLDLLYFTRELVANKKLEELNLSEYTKVRTFAALVNLWRSVPLDNEYNSLIWNELIKYRTNVLVTLDSKLKLKFGAALSFFGRRISHAVMGK